MLHTKVKKAANEPLSLKMYIGLQKHMVFECLYDLFLCMQTYMLSSDIKREYRQNIRK